MGNDAHAQIIMWIIGTGMGVIVVFIGILTSCLSRKVDALMCGKIHEMLNGKLAELSASAKETMNNVIQINIAIASLKAILETQVKTEADRWDRSEIGKKG